MEKESPVLAGLSFFALPEEYQCLGLASVAGRITAVFLL